MVQFRRRCLLTVGDGGFGGQGLTRSVPSRNVTVTCDGKLDAAPDHPGTYRLARDRRRERQTRARPPTPQGRRFFLPRPLNTTRTWEQP